MASVDARNSGAMTPGGGPAVDGEAFGTPRRLRRRFTWVSVLLILVWLPFVASVGLFTWTMFYRGLYQSKGTKSTQDGPRLNIMWGYMTWARQDANSTTAALLPNSWVEGWHVYSVNTDIAWMNAWCWPKFEPEYWKVPFWTTSAIFGAVAGGVHTLVILRRRTRPPGSCVACGYDCSTLPPAAACPECGGLERMPAR